MGNKPIFTRTRWARASEIPSLLNEDGQLQIFHDSVSPDDIKQGNLADCYYLSVLGSLATNQADHIYNLFNLKEVNDQGIFSVNMHVNGKKIEVVMDDYFPVNEWGEPQFSRGNGPELWVLILEKAFAKLQGSYERIEWGHCHAAQRDVTGAPAMNYNLAKLGDDLFCAMMRESVQKDYICTCSSGSADQAAAMKELGLVAAHAYSIVNIADVVSSGGDEVTIVKIRNPWGNFEWNGDWGDESDLWTDESRAICDQ